MQSSPGDTLGAWDTCGSGSARMGQLEGARKHTTAAWAAQLGGRQAPGSMEPHRSSLDSSRTNSFIFQSGLLAPAQEPPRDRGPGKDRDLAETTKLGISKASEKLLPTKLLESTSYDFLKSILQKK